MNPDNLVDPVHVLESVYLLRGGEQFAAAFRKMNAQSLVPVLQDGPLALTQWLALDPFRREAPDRQTDAA